MQLVFPTRLPPEGYQGDYSCRYERYRIYPAPYRERDTSMIANSVWLFSVFVTDHVWYNAFSCLIMNFEPVFNDFIQLKPSLFSAAPVQSNMGA